MQILIDIAMILLMVAMVPQVVEAYKNRRKLKGRSTVFFVITLLGNILAVAWGVLYNQWSIMALNFAYGIWSLMTLFFMWKYRGPFERVSLWLKGR